MLWGFVLEFQNESELIQLMGIDSKGLEHSLRIFLPSQVKIEGDGLQEYTSLNSIINCHRRAILQVFGACKKIVFGNIYII